MGGPTPVHHEGYLAANTGLDAMPREVAQPRCGTRCRARHFAARVSAAGLQTNLAVGPTSAVFHKAVATRAGFGWIGRNVPRVTSALGPRVRLATVFMDMPLSVAAPIVVSRCGTCRRCVDACRITAGRLVRERIGCDDALCGVCVAVYSFSA